MSRGQSRQDSPFPMRRAGHLALLAGLALGARAGAQTAPALPQTTVYIGPNWCRGGYCGNSVNATFQSAMEQALVSSGAVQAVRSASPNALNLNGGITSVSSGGRLCLPVVGCLNGKTVRASAEFVDASNNAVLWQDTCEGTSGGFTTWIRWTGYLQVNSDDDKAAADCAGKLVQKFLSSPAFDTYVARLRAAPAVQAAGTATVAPGASLAAVPAPAVPTTSSGWVYSFFFPDEATRQQACAEGYASASKGVSASPPGRAEFNSTEGTITVDTSYNSIFLACQEAGAKLRVKPDSVPQLDFIVSVKHNTYIGNTSGLAAALAFYDANHAELGRISMYVDGRLADKNRACSSNYGTPTVCTYPFVPDRLSTTERAMISQATSARLLVNMGKGVESLPFSRDRFPALK
ncbi:hypothetical protein [Deinococcus aestuarii]|uniref:hypothetical protein n=1 Tax=Deinococcus aestuarii TaxID=2774531 RepID=UPI001C0BFFC5|nr:hypothetical protein [Deinococcus aestuarii]